MEHKFVLGCTYVLQSLLSIDFASNSDKFGIFFHFCSFFYLIFYFWIFLLMNIMVKISFEGLWGINVYWGALMFCKALFSLIFAILRQIVTTLAFFGHFEAFFSWIFISGPSMNIMIKTSLEWSMGQKCVLGCAYVLQRLLYIDFFEISNK